MAVVWLSLADEPTGAGNHSASHCQTINRRQRVVMKAGELAIDSGGGFDGVRECGMNARIFSLPTTEGVSSFIRHYAAARS